MSRHTGSDLSKSPRIQFSIPVATVLMAALCVLGFSPSGHPAEGVTQAYPAPGLLVRVGDHRLHIFCQGQGSPTVVLDAGLGGNSLDWSRVQPGVAEYTRVCAYDRAGYGWSEPGPLPRDSGRIAYELHKLLHTIAEPAPYLLVGHSFGGYNVRLFASQYPDEVAGLILVDSAHEDQFRRFEENHILPGTGGVTLVVGGAGPKIPENLPEALVPIDEALTTTFRAWYALRGEMASFRDSAREVREAGALPDVPVIVITRGRRVWPQTRRGDVLEKIWDELQDDLAVRTSYRCDRASQNHVYAYRSGHYVHLDEPQLVVDAIRSVVAVDRAQTREFARGRDH